MCLVVFRWLPDHQTPLILLSNRDEFYARPSLEAHYWIDVPHIYGGRDKEKGGSWLAVSKNGRLAAVTNYREAGAAQDLTSRGELVRQFLSGQQSAVSFANAIQTEFANYPGFNALFFDTKNMVYSSNRLEQGYQVLSAGTYGLSNHLLNTPWPKLLSARAAFENTLVEEGDEQDHALLSLMQDRLQAEDAQLPETGVGKEIEKLLSPIFIESPGYGTRTTSLVRFNRKGEFAFTERNYHPTLSETKASIPLYVD